MILTTAARCASKSGVSVRPGTLSYRDIVELLGQHTQRSERLAFLRLYFDFHELYRVKAGCRRTTRPPTPARV